jgi:dihydropteroate synthase
MSSENATENLRRGTLEIDNHTIAWGARTYVMGIINVTPDSFSSDGLLARTEKTPATEASERAITAIAIKQARRFAAGGADIIDVGGESTRPGSDPVSSEVEIARILPVIQALSQELDVLISVDTYKAEVAQAAIQAGAHMVNDVWALRADPGMAAVVARHRVPVVLMHNRSNPATAEVRERLGGRYVGVKYENLLEDVKRELLESVAIALEAEIPQENIILDPGIGFGKTVEQNLELIDRLDEICDLGYPVLLGTSRKSFIGYTLDLPAHQRVEGTAATVAIGIARGADIVRVHDLVEIARVAQMTDAIVRKEGKDPDE